MPNKEVKMEDKIIMDFLASEFLAEKKRLPEGVEIDALAIGIPSRNKTYESTYRRGDTRR